MTIDLTALLKALQENPELAQQLQAALPGEKKTTVTPPLALECPPLDSLTLFQATFFDNGPDGQRPLKTGEFAFTIEAWTNSTDEIRLSEWQWKRTTVLTPHKRFKARLKRLRDSGSLPTDMLDELDAIREELTPQPGETIIPHFGLIGDKGQRTGKKGTNYYAGQFVIAFLDANRLPTSLQFFVGDESIAIDKFDHLDMKGQLLRGNAKRQARLDKGGFHANWPTQHLIIS